MQVRTTVIRRRRVDRKGLSRPRPHFANPSFPISRGQFPLRHHCHLFILLMTCLALTACHSRPRATSPQIDENSEDEFIERLDQARQKIAGHTTANAPTARPIVLAPTPTRTPVNPEPQISPIDDKALPIPTLVSFWPPSPGRSRQWTVTSSDRELLIDSQAGKEAGHRSTKLVASLVETIESVTQMPDGSREAKVIWTIAPEVAENFDELGITLPFEAYRWHDEELSLLHDGWWGGDLAGLPFEASDAAPNAVIAGLPAEHRSDIEISIPAGKFAHCNEFTVRGNCMAFDAVLCPGQGPVKLRRGLCTSMDSHGTIWEVSDASNTPASR